MGKGESSEKGAVEGLGWGAKSKVTFGFRGSFWKGVVKLGRSGWVAEGY